MNEECKIENVVLQENGIVRNSEGMMLGRMGRTIDRDDIVAAVSQAWCTPENEHKEMDATLAGTIVSNVVNLL